MSDAVLEQIERDVEKHPGASAIEALAQVGADPAKYRDTVEALLADDDIEEDEDLDAAVAAGVGVGILLTEEPEDMLTLDDLAVVQTDVVGSEVPILDDTIHTRIYSLDSLCQCDCRTVKVHPKSRVQQSLLLFLYRESGLESHLRRDCEHE